ncbi:hypothetical protein EWM64_g5520 [Hericium alpestre]|uniref:DH domain-containing protein n=1 Tax=Hericium alpestre TaxID=135208 RepID=A0A4Y9ZX49_9AGAM|nr:hypothetical protein EWM64_g5520 [Hericium alpestre]
MQYTPDSPSFPASISASSSPGNPSFPSYSHRSAPEPDDVSYSESTPAPPFLRPPKGAALPDPSQYPDPYPFRSLHQHLGSTPPTLSSGASSASTRSSAYTSSGSALATSEYSPVQVASGEDEEGIGLGITSDEIVQMIAQETPASSSGSQSRVPIDQGRWSLSYSGSIRSRSSLARSNSGSVHEKTLGSPSLHPQPSFDLSWQAVDERDEVDLTSGDETEETDLDDVEEEEEEREQERTSAAVIAEEGRGLIVQGHGVATVHLHVQTGTTHLLVGSSSTPNSIPSFLASSLPQICNTLLALDISANFLNALPPALESCVCLEELNVSSNPIRALPVFIANLTSLRVLIADSTGISNLPSPLSSLEKLHTLSMRRNKMYSLPSWFCLLPSLEMLLVDGNPFQGPWKALVDPLLSKEPATPAYPPSTSIFPLPSASTRASSEADTDLEDEVDFPALETDGRTPEDEDTIMPTRSSLLGRAATEPELEPDRSLPTRGIQLDFVYASQTKHVALRVICISFESVGSGLDARSTSRPAPSLRKFGRHCRLGSCSWFTRRSGCATCVGQVAVGSALVGGAAGEGLSRRKSSAVKDRPTSPPEKEEHTEKHARRQRSGSRRREEKDKEKSGRWGFLKKMSMGKMRSDSHAPPPRPTTAHGRRSAQPLPGPIDRSASAPAPSVPHSTIPQIDVRLPSTEVALVESPAEIPNVSVSLSPAIEEPEKELPSDGPLPPPSPSPGFLSASSLAPPTSRPAKRRSFLPIDTPPVLSIPVPSEFLPGISAIEQTDEAEEEHTQTPSPVIEDIEQYQRREQEKVREAYTRSLRSVMAYLRDMNDLSLSQTNTFSIYGQSLSSADLSGSGTRSRRPTLVETGRVVSDGSMNSMPSIGGSSDQLRSMESIARLRSLSSAQTASVVTTDSNGSSGGEERKYKDDSGKRAMIVREIVETERTYVRGLQELVDIYIKPAGAPVNLLGGVSSAKETVVPAPERKLVFSGLDALFQFHKESFLPSLETAAKPLLRPAAVLAESDADGRLSNEVAKAVANAFVSHAAFMKMYSAYINNFDNSVQRIKYWLSDRSLAGTASPPSHISPSSSNAQMIGLGLAISAISAPAMSPDGVPAGLNLEGYLLLPVQRIPRYRLLLEELIRSTPPTYDYLDPLDKALAEISSLATNMNEGKRESESRRKLVQWQARIRGKFPSPLVQPHRRLIMDGPLLLTRVVRKATIAFEVINAQGDSSNVQVECLSPEQTPRSLVGILCNDLLVLCRDPTDGKDPNAYVDLWAVLRMQTLPQPASIVHGNVLRLVDNKAILYFEASSTSDALTWFRAINLHIPTNKT